MRALSRRVEPERLDALPADDPDAVRSRADLRRLNVVMGQAAWIARELGRPGAVPGMRQVIDLGGGDGTLLLRLARRLAPLRMSVRAVVVDRHALLGPATRAGFADLGWTVEAAERDVFEWLDRTPSEPGTVTIANLFLHHFADPRLRELLARIADRTGLLVACEPRRSRWTLMASARVGWLGCNAVTRADAITSVRAGFTGRELSERWPAGDGWRLLERPVGPFSHLFVARRLDAPPPPRAVPDAPARG